jgi:signal transduction histidine kinase/CheY-like chemotaxis protein
MSQDDTRTLPAKVLHRLGLAGAVLLILSIPAIWLAWEAAEAQATAAMLADAAATKAQAALRDLFARFDRAATSIRSQDLRGDAVSLTGRLLRAEPMIEPASGIQVVNSRGQPIAASSVGAAAITTPVWWYPALPSSPTRRPAILGCGMTASDGSGWMLARDIGGISDEPAGYIASALPEAALRALVTPGGTSSGGTAAAILDYDLSDASGCRLLRGKAPITPAASAAALVRLYRAVLPSHWVDPEPAISIFKAGDLTWTGTVSSRSTLALREAELDRHAGIILIVMLGFGGVTLLMIVARLAERYRRGTAAQGSPPAGGTFGAEATVQGIATRGAEMEDLRRQLATMAGEQDRVLAAIGHDVRTPMNSILGICALLLDGDLDEAQRKWLWRIRASCDALLAMLNGMLEIAAAGVGGSEIRHETIDVASLVEEIGEVLRPEAEDKGLDLFVVIKESTRGVWNTDPTRLRQVLFNLCGNAIKYTAAGSVEIEAQIAHDGAERDWARRDVLRLRVSDTGPGIAAEEREVIFEQFRRGRDEVSRGQEGLGLGLSLCREIAALLGGGLSLDSVAGGGSVFTFEIPIERGVMLTTSDGPLSGRNALVVGLSEGVRHRVASHLGAMGFEVETAGDGFMAIGLAERMAYQHGSLDLIVFDSELVGLPADALLTRLRAGRSPARLRAVLVANGPAAGITADATVPHPVEARDLDRVVAALFGGWSPLQEVDPRAPAAPRPCVLVVEDNRIAQALFVDQLNRAGFSTFSASNGQEAVDAARRGGFGAILMDVQMPEIDGTEAARRIRAAETHSRIPIIGMTAHTGSAVRKRCLAAGMDLVLHKPMDFSSLPLRLREVIAAATSATGTETRQEAAQTDEGALDIEDQSLETLLAEVGAKRARNYIGAFLADTAVHVTTLTRLLNDGDWEELGRLAHSLSGIAGSLGAISLADGLLLLEDAARLRVDEHAAAALNDVRSTWGRVRVLLRPRFEALASGRSADNSRRAA